MSYPCPPCCGATCAAHSDCHVVSYPATVDLVVPDDFTDSGCNACNTIGTTYTLNNNTAAPAWGLLTVPIRVPAEALDYVYWYIDDEYCTPVPGFQTGLAIWCWVFCDVTTGRCFVRAGIELQSETVGNHYGQYWIYQKAVQPARDFASDSIVLPFALTFENLTPTYAVLCTENDYPASVTLQPT